MQEHVLTDGRRVTVRAIRPDDAEALRAAFTRLSPESRERRFFTGMAELSDEQLYYLTHVDGENHVALVALWETPDLKEERGVGVARFIRLEGDPAIAEAAVVVADEMRRCGLGRILLTELTRVARAKGVKTYRAEVQTANAPVRHILDVVGATLVDATGGAAVFDVDIGGADAGGLDDGEPGVVDDERLGALQRLLRAFASSVVDFLRTLPGTRP